MNWDSFFKIGGWASFLWLVGREIFYWKKKPNLVINTLIKNRDIIKWTCVHTKRVRKVATLIITNMGEMVALHCGATINIKYAPSNSNI